TSVTTAAVVAGGPRASAVDFAIVHAAIYDAVNAIDGRHAVYKVDPAAPTAGASKEAAAAAYRTLKGLFPAQAATFDVAYATSIASIPNGSSKSRGIAVGEEVAARMLELRSNDGRTAPAPVYQFGTGPGVYQATVPFPPAGQPINTWLPNVTPMVINAPWQFRAYGPPGLTSARYTKDLLETRAWGSSTSTLRSEAQSEIARFHTENPNQFWGRNFGAFVARRNLGTAGSARLMALLAFAQADAAIACFDSKYAYDFWRPSTAIQQADTDGNPQTSPDAAWTSFVNTPPHPEYPAAHACLAGATAETIRAYFGTRHVKLAFDSTVTGMTHYYRTTDDLVGEIIDARVYGGMHYRLSGEAGAVLGRQVAKWIGHHSLEKVKSGKR
ncbi:vanadium-dependent haloperoxidase, partial [Povalibacter sp.]|uniref:vanadium-dependent haloperoxidase n=1 Tax=Povalibacter sp. TaxID=1962978 RepID=UPI002F3FCE90